MYRRVAVAAFSALVIAGLVATPATASPPPSSDAPAGPAVYSGTVTQAGLEAIVGLGVDRHELVLEPAADPGEVEVQVILNAEQAAALEETGTTLEPSAAPDAGRMSLLATEGVFRMYGGDGGILEELKAQAAAHRKIAEYRVIGRTWQGQEIGAVRVTGAIAKQKKDGKRPTTVYSAHSTPVSGSPRRWSGGCSTTCCPATARTPGSRSS